MDTILDARIDEAVDRLAVEFEGTFSSETVSKCAFEDWNIEDPAGQPLLKVREIRDSIQSRVEDMLGKLEIPIKALRRR